VLIDRALIAIGAAPEYRLVERLFARFRARYAEEPCRASTLYPGCQDLLAALASAGLCLGLCTNKPQAATTGLLAALGVDGAFTSVIGGDALPVRKPDPAHLAAVIAGLDATPTTTVMVGDSRNDVATAKGLGVPVVLVSFGYTAVPARDLGAVAVVDRLVDLPAALEGLTRSGPLSS
jgi:phosphoglycolate phosphatase